MLSFSANSVAEASSRTTQRFQASVHRLAKSPCLGRWVNRKTIFLFCVLDSIIAISNALIYIEYSPVAKLGFIVTSWQIFALSLSFRAANDILGAVSAVRRKVVGIRVFWISLMIGIALSFFALIPFKRCKCKCKVVHFLDSDSLQCEIVRGFASRDQELLAIGGPRRLASPTYVMEDEAVSTNVSVVADSSKNYASLSFFAAATASVNANSNYSIQNRHCSDEELVTGDDHGDQCRFPHWLAKETPLKDLSRTLTAFNVTELGIAWVPYDFRNRRLDPVCETKKIPKDEDRPEWLIDDFRTFQCSAGSDSLVGYKWRDRLAPLKDKLDQCILDESCIVISAHIPHREDGTRVRLCRLKLPIIPTIQIADMEKAAPCFGGHRKPFFLKNPDVVGWNVYFLKNVVSERNLDRAVRKAGSGRCRWVVEFSFVSMILMNVLSLPMIPVVLKFLRNRCGDAFEVNSQFDVKTSKFNDGDSDDDFDVLSVSAHSSEISNNASRASRASRASGASRSSGKTARSKGSSSCAKQNRQAGDGLFEMEQFGKHDNRYT